MNDQMKTITKEWLVEEGACSSGVKWFLAQTETSTAKIMLKLVEEDLWGHALWILEHIMDKEQSVKLAIFSARLCLDNFEKLYPDDDRPRKAIEASEAYLLNPCEETRQAAYSAAYSAADSAADSAYSAALAALAAAAAADSADAADSAGSAYSAADSALAAARSADSAADSAGQKTIIIKAIEICEL